MRSTTLLIVVSLCGLLVLPPFFLSAPKASPEKLTFRVMTANIGHCSHFPKPSIEDWVEVLNIDPKPNILLLQDVQNQQSVDRLAKELGYRYWVTDAGYRSKGIDLAILSRWKLKDSEYLSFKASRTGKGFLWAEIEVQDKEFLVCTVHLDRVRHVPRRKDKELDFPWKGLFNDLYQEIFTQTVRSKSAKELIIWLKENREVPVIIGGDFNTIPLSRTIWKMCRAYEDVLWPSWDFFRGTYRLIDLPLKPRIDYIFYSEGMDCLEARIVRRSAGDHFPVVAELRIKD